MGNNTDDLFEVSTVLLFVIVKLPPLTADENNMLVVVTIAPLVEIESIRPTLGAAVPPNARHDTCVPLVIVLT
jgi:hypothetical protein